MFRVFIVFFLVFSTNIFSQEQPIGTDRPDQTDSPILVPQGSFQIETGLSYVSYSKAVSDFNFATSLFRYGLNESIELRAFTQFTSRTYEFFGNLTSESGLNGLDLSTKIKLNVFNEVIPNTALIASLFLPLGNDMIVPDDVVPGVLFAALNPLSGNLSLGWNVGFFLVNGSDVSLRYSASLGIPINQQLAGFVELFGDITNDVEDGFVFDGGVTYLLSNDIQLDGSLGVGLTEGSPDFLINGGFSIRFPN